MAASTRGILTGLWRAALVAADPGRCVREAMARGTVDRALRGVRGRVGVFAVGKAASGMFTAATTRLPGAEGLVVLPAGYPPPRAAAHAEVLFAAHPEPDRRSVAAARRAIAYFASFSEDDLVLCLVSGGTSSLLCLPKRGLSLAEKRARIRRLARSGASIARLNRLRTSLSAVKGGRLGRATKARLVTLVLSDVAGDDPAVVGSGPTVRGRRGDLVRVVGTNASGLRAAAAAALGQGLRPVRLPRIEGDAARQGRTLARRALRLETGEVLLAGGETTVRLSGAPGRGRRGGRGGRCLELAAAAASALARSDAVLLAAASDGLDGTSGAAGAFSDGTTVDRARLCGLSVDRALEGHDTAPLFEGLGDLFVTGPTGTNVCDWVIAVRQGTGDR